MPEINYHVPTNPKKPKFEWRFSVILNILNTGFFLVVATLLVGGACGVDREAVCRGMSGMALMASCGLAALLLFYGVYRFDHTSAFMRWFTIGLPLIPIILIVIRLLSFRF
ncbi:hypothetical protein [Herpetosiphon llansteffanensis]|uniref:hypothetical protein n=1 Tax=Herpetosiphon llansteffanensis TaxID=2094568 RepID=UPI000F51AD00|nr:hypothetical protein [Herpetosiphon llansteffanensis]